MNRFVIDTPIATTSGGVCNVLMPPLWVSGLLVKE
jgi:hypothetical protein